MTPIPTSVLDANPITVESFPTPAAAPLHTLESLRGLWATEAETAREASLSGTPRGPITGLAKLDKALGGHLAPGLHFVHGEPGAGKTAFALQVAATCGAPAVFVTTEMSPLVLLRRLIARVTGTFQGELSAGTLSPAEMMSLFDRAAAACPLLAIVDATRGSVEPWRLDDKEPAGIREQAELWRDHHGARHVLVVVDSLHSWAAARASLDRLTEYERLNAAISDLQHVATMLTAPVLAVSERNRANMESDGQNASAGTRRFEYSAESVIALNPSPEIAAAAAAGEKAITARLAKNRNGETGIKVDLRFNGALASFREAKP